MATYVSNEANLGNEFLRELLLDLVMLLNVRGAHIYIHSEHSADRILSHGVEIHTESDRTCATVLGVY